MKHVYHVLFTREQESIDIYQNLEVVLNIGEKIPQINVTGSSIITDLLHILMYYYRLRHLTFNQSHLSNPFALFVMEYPYDSIFTSSVSMF